MEHYSFKILKQTVTLALVLELLDFSKVFLVGVDASMPEIIVALMENSNHIPYIN